jgi:hypothetical protein
MRASELDPHYEFPIMPSDRTDRKNVVFGLFEIFFALPRQSTTVKANKHNSLGDIKGGVLSRCMAA